MNRKMLVLTLGMALLAGGCGRLSAANTTSGGAGGLQPVTIGLGRQGQVVTIHAGQSLIVQLGPSFKVPQGEDPLVGFPKGLLTFSNAQVSAGTYIFTSHRAGSGSVWIMNPGCHGGPADSVSGANVAASGPQCPLVGPGPATASKASLVYTITVRVGPIGQ